MTKASENQFPKITLAESASPGTPTSGLGYIYTSTGGTPYYVNDSGVETPMLGGGGGAVATDAIWDAKGDVAVGTGANAASRLAVGSNGQVLTAASGESTGLKWAAAASRAYLDTYSAPLDGTMGDDFDGASLNGRWTRRTIVSGWESYQQGNSTWLTTSIGSATQDCQYEQSCPSGDWEFIASFSVTRSHGSPMMYGLGCKDSSGNGRGVTFYTDGIAYLATIASHVYNTYASNFGTGSAYTFQAGAKLWARLRKSGNTIYGSYSTNGEIWSMELSVGDSSTWATVAIGRFYGSQSSGEVMSIDLFDRVA